MSENTLQGLMKTTMDNLKEMIDVNTIVGDPVETVDGTIIIPVSRVTVGFGSGGTEMCEGSNSSKESGSCGSYPFGGGSGAGMAVTPVSFLVVTREQVRLLPVGQMNTLERLIDNIPDVLEKIVDSFKKDKHFKDSKPDFTVNPT
ncbi:GerW family sporulation protein [Clostridium cylindrosporum]|uniref:Sporulation protein YtfJ n=1 Tax=Clostridium cylindrosporum DSM 605 TaxID=1121307 RepID=A0A0J8DAP4_CLOCY|nr:GerW family sporulation protein [Clostridium cylindrosporum]KMT21373.1 sporulation protein YtfJ [Clostridium cylindrosporum DSM 605]